MKSYFDTSIFVPLTILELKTKAVQQWFSECEPMEIVISDWTVVEFHSALALKLRTGQIDTGLRDGAQELFARYTSENFQVIEVTRADFGRAATLADKEALKLRGETHYTWQLLSAKSSRFALSTSICSKQQLLLACQRSRSDAVMSHCRPIQKVLFALP